MLSYKELQQLLRPIEDQDEDEYPHNNQQLNQNVLPNQPQNSKQHPQQNTKNPQSNQNNKQQQMQRKVQKLELVLSHRELRKIPVFIPFHQYPICSLSLSFNYLKDLKPFKDMESQYLEYLNLSFNFLTSLEHLGKSFCNLKTIDANANLIQSLNISDNQFPVLESLYLKNNKIKYFIHCPTSLQILCLDHNKLEKLAFTGGDSLQVLSASDNKISEFYIEKTDHICFIDLEENEISDMTTFQKVLQKCKSLLSLNMIGNYVSKIAHKRYMIQVLTTCPKLVKVDEVVINPHVREAFKVMKQEDKMELQMKETQQKYRKRMEQQLQLKQQMLEQLKNQQKQLEDKFYDFLNKEKQQLDALENYAKNNLGKKKLAIAQQNKQFIALTSNYNKQPTKPQDSKYGKQNKPQEIANQMTAVLASGVIEKHRDQYQSFQKNKSGLKEEKKKNKIRSYSSIPDKNEHNNSNNSIEESQNEMSDQEELTAQQIQRRKKNMRNPHLVYRNSNQLIGASQISIDAEIKSSDEEEVFNKKCLPYLVKKYGFHTVV